MPHYQCPEHCLRNTRENNQHLVHNNWSICLYKGCQETLHVVLSKTLDVFTLTFDILKSQLAVANTFFAIINPNKTICGICAYITQLQQTVLNNLAYTSQLQ